MNVEQLKNIENLIQLGPNEKIKSHKLKRLTAPGENYGSLMLSVEISVETPTGNEEVHAIAKMVPPNEFIQEIFNTQVTFRNEIAFYKKIVPLLRDFQKEHGVEELVDFAAKYYGSRINLKDDENGKVDEDAALVLENLVTCGFVTLNRLDCLDLEAAKLVIVNLAQLHAIPLALKIKKPEVFEKEIKPYLTPLSFKEEMHGKMKEDFEKLFDKTDKLDSLRGRIMAGFDRLIEVHEPRELFATIVHNDCWSNNNMFKLEGGTPVKSKMVDFQICSYGSPARDVVFFIYSSLRDEVIELHYDALIDLYYQTFIKTLKELDCDTNKLTREAFQKELDFEAKHSQFAHIAFMLTPIFAPKGTAKDFHEMAPQDMGMSNELTDLHISKHVFISKEFAKRNWI